MRLKLKNNHTMVFGLKGSGKSNWVQYVLNQPAYQAHLMYDVCREHEPLRCYLPEHRRGDKAIAEFNEVLNRMIIEVEREQRPEVLAIEEVSRLAPNRGGSPESLLELIDLNRHYGVGVVGVARRPAQVDTDLVELADNLIIFKLTGKNDYRRLESEKRGLGDAARELGEYEYLVVNGKREYETHRPVPKMNTTGTL